MHPLKRRRIEQVTSTLTRPFRSPLRTSAGDASKQAIAGKGQLMPKEQVTPSHDGLPPLSPRSLALHPTDEEASVSVDHAGAPSGVMSTLQQDYTVLSRELNHLRQCLDTAQQASRIQSTNRDTETRELTEKWKMVVRVAAEDLFEHAKAYGASHNPFECHHKTPFFHEREEPVLTDEEKHILEFQRKEEEAQAIKYGLVDKPDTEMVENKSLTMETMLRQMNVDLDLVGYDENQQRWVD